MSRRLARAQWAAAVEGEACGHCPAGRRTADQRAVELTAVGAGERIAVPALCRGWVVSRLPGSGR